MGIYVLFGLETYLMEKELARIINKESGDNSSDLSVNVYDCEETPVQTAIQDAEMLSLMLERKKVIIKNASFLTGQKSNDKKVKHDLETVERYLEEPNEETDLIFMVKYEKLDSRKKIVKSLKKSADIIEVSHLKEFEAKKWIKGEAEKLNITITKEAVEQLYLLIGSNLQMLSKEIEKLAMYVGEKGKVNAGTIHLLVKKTLEQNTFLIIEKIGKKQFAEAHSIFRELMIQKIEPIMIAATISKQFSRMLEAKAHIHNGAEQKDLPKLLGIQPYPAKIIVNQAKGFHETTLQQILHRLSQMDFEFKRGGDKELIFEMFLVDLQKIS
ncbi:MULTISPECIES: DNA polymerase III subunit delta [Bacillus cereus group]|uniref:DNA polymerase III subunit delta n=1 Tax=Bacillus cereus group TaxID=86661 RepID=UPI003D66279F